MLTPSSNERPSTLEPQPPQRILAAESTATASESMLTESRLDPDLASVLPCMLSKSRSLPYLSIQARSILSFQVLSHAPFAEQTKLESACCLCIQ